jgi:hypothetical protein
MKYRFFLRTCLLLGFWASIAQAETVTLGWQIPEPNPDNLTAVTTMVYRAQREGGPWVEVCRVPIATMTCNDKTVQRGIRYWWTARTKAVDTGRDVFSEQSLKVQMRLPAAPATVEGLTATAQPGPPPKQRQRY